MGDGDSILTWRELRIGLTWLLFVVFNMAMIFLLAEYHGRPAGFWLYMLNSGGNTLFGYRCYSEGRRRANDGD